MVARVGERLTEESADYRISCDAEHADDDEWDNSHRPTGGSTITVALARHSGIVAAA